MRSGSKLGSILSQPGERKYGIFRSGSSWSSAFSVLADEDVDPRELVLEIGAAVRILRHGQERDAALSLPDRFVLSPQIRQREAEEDVALRILGSRAKLLLEGLSRLLGVGPHVRRIALQGVGLGKAEAPVASVVVERARREAQKQLALRLVENPDEVPLVRHAGHERGGLDLLRRGLDDGPCSGQISLHRGRSWP